MGNWNDVWCPQKNILYTIIERNGVLKIHAGFSPFFLTGFWFWFYSILLCSLLNSILRVFSPSLVFFLLNFHLFLYNCCWFPKIFHLLFTVLLQEVVINHLDWFSFYFIQKFVEIPFHASLSLPNPSKFLYFFFSWISA